MCYCHQQFQGNENLWLEALFNSLSTDRQQQAQKEAQEQKPDDIKSTFSNEMIVESVMLIHNLTVLCFNNCSWIKKTYGEARQE